MRVTRPKRRREPGTRDWYWPAISNCGLAGYQLLGLRSRQRHDGEIRDELGQTQPEILRFMMMVHLMAAGVKCRIVEIENVVEQI